MNKEEKRYVIEGSAKALVSLIPGIGGAINAVLSDALAERKEKRFTEFISQLNIDLASYKQFVNSNFVNHEEFLDVFELTSKKIVSERTEEKRIAYKNILLTGILSENYNYDDIEYYLRLLDQLTSDHILLLKLFKHGKSTENENFKTISTNTILSFFKRILPEWKDFDFLFDHLRDLENLRLVENITPNFRTMMTNVTIETLKANLTSRGATFLSFILK